MSKAQFVKLKNLFRWRHVESVSCPKSFLASAKKESAKPTYLCAADYGKIVDVLRSKGFTWPEIVEWLAAKGVNYSKQGIKAGWVRWKEQQGLNHRDD